MGETKCLSPATQVMAESLMFAAIGGAVLLLVIIVAVVMYKKKKSAAGGGAGSSGVDKSGPITLNYEGVMTDTFDEELSPSAHHYDSAMAM